MAAVYVPSWPIRIVIRSYRRAVATASAWLANRPPGSWIGAQRWMPAVVSAKPAVLAVVVLADAVGTPATSAHAAAAAAMKRLIGTPWCDFRGEPGAAVPSDPPGPDRGYRHAVGDLHHRAERRPRVDWEHRERGRSQAGNRRARPAIGLQLRRARRRERVAVRAGADDRPVARPARGRHLLRGLRGRAAAVGAGRARPRRHRRALRRRAPGAGRVQRRARGGGAG